MKIISMKLAILSLCVAALALTSCDSYLNTVPKGKKIPKTLAEYEALLRSEYSVHRVPLLYPNLMLGDYYMVPYDQLQTAVMNWDESVNRIEMGDGNNDVSPYYDVYSSIAICNLILDDGPTTTEATEAQKAEVMAYATVIRAMRYYEMAQVYAQPYDATTAAQTRSVPLITSSGVGASYTQPPLSEFYGFITSEVERVLSDGSLPAQSMTVLHPNRGAAYAFLARVYLTMGQYSAALTNAELALAENDQLFDWVAFYNANASEIDTWDDNKTIVSPMAYDYVENYNMAHYTTNAGRNQSMPVERAAGFEENDLRFKASYYHYTAGGREYYRSRLTGYFNIAGMKTVEAYLIKAECLARAGSYDLAMDELNKVREKRVSPYTPLTASTEAECIEAIRQWKENELMFSIVPFADYRRFNKESAYARTLTKQVDGVTVTLTPQSHLWTFPFPTGAVANTSGGTIEHNVNR